MHSRWLYYGPSPVHKNTQNVSHLLSQFFLLLLFPRDPILFPHPSRLPCVTICSHSRTFNKTCKNSWRPFLETQPRLVFLELWKIHIDYCFSAARLCEKSIWITVDYCFFCCALREHLAYHTRFWIQQLMLSKNAMSKRCVSVFACFVCT